MCWLMTNWIYLNACRQQVGKHRSGTRILPSLSNRKLHRREIRFNAELKLGLNQAAEVMTKHLAQRLIDLCRIAFASQATAEFTLIMLNLHSALLRLSRSCHAT